MRKLICIALFLIPQIVYSQDYPRKDFNLEKLTDEIFPIQDLDLNYEDLYENLAQLLSNPIDLNSITREQLQGLFVVNENEIDKFLSYRTENGPLLSVYELQSIPDWSRATFDKIIPFVTVIDPQSKLNSSLFKRVSEEKNNYLVIRIERSIETKKGYKSETDSSQRYQGSPEKLYLRYRVSRSNDFSFGFTAEKDPGEVLQWLPSQQYYGLDYLSIHAQVMNKGKLKNLIVGDYQTQFGQGLILGSAFGFGKNSETVTTVRRGNLGFLPYTSAGESNFFRGASGSYALSENFTLHAFFSSTKKDGTINQETEEDVVVSSFNASGLHRTPTEIQRRQRITETGKGIVIQFRTSRIDAGAIFHQIDFSEPVLRTTFPYNQFAFNGSVNRNAGIFVNFHWSNFTFFTEAAQTIDHGNAITAGLLGNLSNQLEVSMLYRNFSKDFYSFYSNALSESSTPQNEEGFYWGWKYSFNKKFTASGYMDIFQFPWLRYRSYSPSDGSEWLIRFNYTPSKKKYYYLYR
ncbi:MAG: helix-hairpin-helix domain-containing protein [Cyclobacteriaceae bacterium]|nr:helix-hairpin-helix domain-containing protein [Cyclobacteriaceae bacterium]